MNDTWDLWKDVRENHFTKGELQLTSLMVKIIGAIVMKNKELGWTQQEISKKTGISQPNLSKYFSFDLVPKVETIAKLLDVFGLEITVANKEGSR